VDTPLSGSSVAAAIGKAFRLNSDRERHGQDAFTASPFSRLLITHVLSLAGDALVTLALAGSIFFSTSLTAARGRVALTLVLTIAPFAIVAPLLGPIIDKAGSRRLMVVITAVGRGIACLLMAKYINSIGLYPAALLSLVCSKGYTVTKATLVPPTVQSPRDLVEANSKLAVSGAIAGFLIAIPGVAILKLAGGAWVLRSDILVFAACAVSAFRLQVPRSEKAVAGADHTAILVGQEAAAAAAREVRAKPIPAGSIQVAAFAMGVLRFLVGFLTFLMAFAFRASHAATWWYGVALGCSIGGGLIGAAVAPWLRSRLREELILAGSAVAVAGAGVLALFFSAFKGRPAASLLAGVVGLAAGGAKLAFDALVQRHIPAANQGRAFGRFEAGFQLVWVIGALLPVVVALSLTAGFLVVAIAATVAAVAFLVGTRMARLGQLPAWWPGVRPPRSRRARIKPDGGAGPDDASPADATVPFRSPRPGATPSSPAEAATVPLGATTGWVPPRDRPTQEDRPWLDPEPDLGIYPPPISGPPPLGRSGRPIPPPLSGPAPLAAPLAPRPRRPYGEAPEPPPAE